MVVVDSIKTARMELIPSSGDYLKAALEDHRRLSDLLAARVPETWPPPDLAEVLALFQKILNDTPTLRSWLIYHWIYEDPSTGKRTLIGDGGFKSPPLADGSIEIGYGVLPQFQGRGLATEAAQGLIKMAFADQRVIRVMGQTTPDNIASIRVLEKLGFSPAGPGIEPGHLMYHLERTK